MYNIIISIHYNMNDIINKVYVINLKNRPDRWTDVNKSFKNTGLKLTRWNAVYGKDLSEEEIKNVTTPISYHTIPHSIIGCWLSHYNIWKHIVENKETNVLILEDDAYPVDNFTNKLYKYWKEVPDDWDMIYLGCTGTCSGAPLVKILFHTITLKKNSPIYKNTKKCKHVYKPGYPLNLHSYMLSYNGAKKIINHPKMKKITGHIDGKIAHHVLNNNDFNVYAFTPQLAYQNESFGYSDNTSSTHPIIE